MAIIRGQLEPQSRLDLRSVKLQEVERQDVGLRQQIGYEAGRPDSRKVMSERNTLSHILEPRLPS